MKTKQLLYPLLLSLALSLSAALASHGKETEIITSQAKDQDNTFDVTFLPKEEKVEVTTVKESSLGAPPHMKIRILRKKQQPIEVQLRTVSLPPSGSRTDSPLRYTGPLDQWHESYIGFELVFSFDKKTWKKIRASF